MTGKSITKSKGPDDLLTWFQRRTLLFAAFFLMGFGFLNLFTHNIAVALQAQPADMPSADLITTIVEGLITAVVPIVGGAVSLAIGYARTHGLKINADAEEYFVNSAKSFVANESRFLYKEIKKSPAYQQQLLQGRIPEGLGKDAKNHVIERLKKELESPEFRGKTKDMLTANLDVLIERYVTENKKETADKVRTLFKELVPIAVDAALLSFKTPQEAQGKIEDIKKDALKSVARAFEFEELLVSHEDIMTRIMAELNKKIGGVK